MPNINAFRPVVYEKKIFEYLSKFSIFCPLLGPSPFIWTNLNPHPPQVWFLPRSVEIDPVVLEKKLIKEKLMDDDDADDRRITMAKAHMSLWLRW